MRSKLTCLCLMPVLLVAGCKQKPAPTAATAAKAKLGIRPHGDETITFDQSKMSPELTKTFEYIDEHIDEHVENLQNWVRQPSISNSGEGIPESAEMVKGMFDKFGCQSTKVYDVGMTEYGSPGNPVVYAKCDFGAPKTLAFYWMYDTMPVTQPDAWIAPPFEGRIVSGEVAGVPGATKVMIARGAVNTKGSQMVTLNALTALKESMGGKLPVNVIFLAEGDEERMSVGLRQFMKQHSDLLKDADALYAGGPSEGCVYVELTTSGTSWGRGPTESDIHGIWKRAADSPAWRHIQMLASLTSKDGNTPLIKGFLDNMEQPTPQQLDMLKLAGSKMDLKAAAKAVGVARFTSDDPATMLKMLQYGTSFNLDGIWGGNMYAGGAGAILPNKITSKHNIRYVPKMNGPDLVKKLRAQLDANGYPDVQVKLIGDVPWSRGSSPKNDITTAHNQAMALMGMNALDSMAMFFGSSSSKDAPKDAAKPDAPKEAPKTAFDGPMPGYPAVMDRPVAGGYWPSYLFTDGEVGEKIGTASMPMGMTFGSFSAGGRAHAANEYFVIEGKGRTPGMATAEKYVAATVLNYAKTTTVPIRPKTPVQ
ncbi:Acetylornithine deacetylase/Succinyl-diaminopimelate desuccinylase [Granulicella rosea]|uniref:Acetylornithine deacetylase/Succinyl-diaminopimelate desuccinylase n=1 Tax=Granulicella rosea TaxID=474952 RepID=A0A239EIX4_9BACT|nr:M20/M25/M40 family metallo-hydrolase [Granulicella rosea]SNS43852.1 Acetylornithine deacetylase/Succinyl-diaminopimelate desuccinylase [Granulicella rosea]